METIFYQRAKAYTRQFSNFNPFADTVQMDSFSPTPDFSSLSDEIKIKCINEAEKYYHFSFPSLPASLFMDFTRTGNRVRYENVYFSKRIALNALVIGECFEQQGRFMDDIINGVFSICEESAWQLPAHNTYIRDSKQLLLPDVTNPILDLFACETGALLSVVYYLYHDIFDVISPFLNTMINAILMNRIITPYLTQHFWWMGRENEPMCNWTIWCTQNVLLTCFLSNTTDEIKRDIFEKAALSTDYFLKEYGEDGCCDEGAQYYHHAGLCLFNTLEILNNITGGFFTPVFHMPKICNIASYICNVHVGGPYFVNFADCSPIAGRAGAREFLFGVRTGQPALCQFAATDYQASTDPLQFGEIDLFYRLQALFTDSAINSYYHDHKGKNNLPDDIFYQSVGIFIARSKHLTLAVKAGDNDDSHNHNDTGSFTIYKNNLPFLIDIGVESYTQKTFSDKRYEIWTMQSCYHNLPTILGMDQRAGSKYRAENVLCDFNDSNKPGISMHLENAYLEESSEPLPYTYIRNAFLDKEQNCITIKDCFSPTQEENTLNDFISPVILNLMTYEKPSFLDGLLQIGDLGTIQFSSDSPIEPEIEVYPIEDERLKTAWEHEIYRTRIRFSRQLTLTIS